MQYQKNKLRRTVIDLRNSLSTEEVKEKSSKIIEKLINLNEFKNSKIIMCYVDFKNEVETRELIDYCLKKGKRVAVPFVASVSKENREIIASEIIDFDNDLQPGAYGIFEPKRNLVRQIESDEIDIVVVPGVVFDKKRNRIGYGAGFYDRFLGKVKRECMKIAIAFDLQLIDEIPVEQFDIPMDLIITEAQTIC